MDIKTIAISKQMDERRNVLRYPNGPLSPAAPITPTVSGFDTDPTDLGNVTDGDLTTASATGSKVMGASGVYGYLIFDMGSAKNVIISAKVGIWSTASTTSAYLETSPDGTNWVTVGANTIRPAGTSASEVINSVLINGVHTRYFRIRFSVGAAATAYAKIYTVTAYALE